MATYALPTAEENEARPHRYRQWLKTLPTWQLEIWANEPLADDKHQMIVDELKARSPPPCTACGEPIRGPSLVITTADQSRWYHAHCDPLRDKLGWRWRPSGPDLEIRAASRQGVTAATLAAQYSVSITHIHRIRSGACWH